jgi:predicted RNA binding protein YcfA (HicA-like mRNA interferase family)
MLYGGDVTGKELVRLLQENGFVLERIKGSHHLMVKDGLTIPVPVHGKRELPTGTASAILKQAGLR